MSGPMRTDDTMSGPMRTDDTMVDQWYDSMLVSDLLKSSTALVHEDEEDVDKKLKLLEILRYLTGEEIPADPSYSPGTIATGDRYVEHPSFYDLPLPRIETFSVKPAERCFTDLGSNLNRTSNSLVSEYFPISPCSLDSTYDSNYDVMLEAERFSFDADRLLVQQHEQFYHAHNRDVTVNNQSTFCNTTADNELVENSAYFSTPSLLCHTLLPFSHAPLPLSPPLSTTSDISDSTCSYLESPSPLMTSCCSSPFSFTGHASEYTDQMRMPLLTNLDQQPLCSNTTSQLSSANISTVHLTTPPASPALSNSVSPPPVCQSTEKVSLPLDTSSIDSAPAGSGSMSITGNNSGSCNEAPPRKRGRGRPRKHQGLTMCYNSSSSSSSSSSSCSSSSSSSRSSSNKVAKRKSHVNSKISSASASEHQRCRKRPHGNKSLHLWEFLLTLLEDSDYNTEWIRWENKEEGIFVIVPGKSRDIAELWGKIKNNPTMNYDKMSRSLRWCRLYGSMREVPKGKGYPKKRCFRFSHTEQDLKKMEQLVALAKNN